MSSGPILLWVGDDVPGGALWTRLAALGQAEGVAQSKLKARLNELLPGCSVVFVASDSAARLADLEAITGVVPLLVVAEQVPSVTADGHVIRLSSLNRLAGLMEDGAPEAVLGLVRLDAAKVAAVQNGLAQHLRDAVAVAGGIHIYGAGTVGRQVLGECRRGGLAVAGFVDNELTRQGGTVEGVAVRAPASLDRNRDVVVVSVGNHAATIAADLTAQGFRHVVNLSQLFYTLHSPSQPEQDYLFDLDANRLRWLALTLLLEDQRSREVIDAVVRLRLGLDIAPVAAVCEREIPQWFDPAFMRSRADAVFVDGGAYDGDTAEAFRRINGPCQRIHAFELDPEIAARATARLANYPEAVVHPMGLSNRRARLGFERTGVTNGHLQPDAVDTCFVDVCAVDDAVSCPVTYIKLDVEGEEANAIAGAARTIGRLRPLLALAVYHRVGDIWSLPEQVLAIEPNYRLYLRHYTQLAFETVLYAVPDGGAETL